MKFGATAGHRVQSYVVGSGFIVLLFPQLNPRFSLLWQHIVKCLDAVEVHVIFWGFAVVSSFDGKMCGSVLPKDLKDLLIYLKCNSFSLFTCTNILEKLDSKSYLVHCESLLLNSRNLGIKA